MKEIIAHIKTIENGFRHIIEAGDTLLADPKLKHLQLAGTFLEDPAYQVRMLGTYLLGQLSPLQPKGLKLLETRVAKEENWRVQEMLAKAFDHYCQEMGYQQSLPVIERWLANKNPNVKRAVTEGLRIWTGRPYFKENPARAIQLIAQCKNEESEYLRKSIGNALRDIRKKHRTLVDAEIATWDLNNSRLMFIQKLVLK